MSDRVVIYHDLDGDDPEFDFHVTHLSGTPIVGNERDDVLARIRHAVTSDADRAVLDAAEAAVEAFDADTLAYPTSRVQLTALGDLIDAVRARREAQR
jgi:hypothetical protein